MRIWIASVGIALGAVALTSHTPAHADPAPQPHPVPTVQLSQIPLDDYPVCHVEDCSDVPNQEGLWHSPTTGSWYFEQGERTWRIVP